MSYTFGDSLRAGSGRNWIYMKMWQRLVTGTISETGQREGQTDKQTKRKAGMVSA